jgi:hypothetical protein
VDGPYVPVHFSPDVEVPPLTPRDGPIAEGALIRLTGQFDHPASATCDRSPTSSAYPHLEADLILLWCRQQFVVESWEPVNE